MKTKTYEVTVNADMVKTGMFDTFSTLLNFRFFELEAMKQEKRISALQSKESPSKADKDALKALQSELADWKSNDTVLKYYNEENKTAFSALPDCDKRVINAFCGVWYNFFNAGLLFKATLKNDGKSIKNLVKIMLHNFCSGLEESTLFNPCQLKPLDSFTVGGKSESIAQVFRHIIIKGFNRKNYTLSSVSERQFKAQLLLYILRCMKEHLILSADELAEVATLASEADTVTDERKKAYKAVSLEATTAEIVDVLDAPSAKKDKKQ